MQRLSPPLNAEKKQLSMKRMKNLGRKLYITGKGRCNVTNNCDMDQLFCRCCHKQALFLQRVLRLYEYGYYGASGGCGLPSEDGTRRPRFPPVSDESSDVSISALSKRLRALDVDIRLNEGVKGLSLEEGALKGVILERGSKKEAASAVIVATGGLSYPTTGSTGRRVPLQQKRRATA